MLEAQRTSQTMNFKLSQKGRRQMARAMMEVLMYVLDLLAFALNTDTF